MYYPAPHPLPTPTAEAERARRDVIHPHHVTRLEGRTVAAAGAELVCAGWWLDPVQPAPVAGYVALYPYRHRDGRRYGVLCVAGDGYVLAEYTPAGAR